MPSLLPDAKYLPLDENETVFIALICPFNAINSIFYSTLQIFTVRSLLPEAIYLPSGENAIE
jgi:hypothetical protein